MNSSPRCIKTTIKNEHVQKAVEDYLRQIQLLGDHEIVKLDYDKDFPLTISTENHNQEVRLIEH